MPDKKLTDNEIIKALEKQANEKRCTFEQYEEACGMWCKYHHKWCADMSGIDNKQNCADYTPSSATRIAKATLDLINRLQAKLDEAEDTIQFADKELKKANTEIERLSLLVELGNMQKTVTNICEKEL